MLILSFIGSFLDPSEVPLSRELPPACLSTWADRSAGSTFLKYRKLSHLQLLAGTSRHPLGSLIRQTQASSYLPTLAPGISQSSFAQRHSGHIDPAQHNCFFKGPHGSPLLMCLEGKEAAAPPSCLGENKDSAPQQVPPKTGLHSVLPISPYLETLYPPVGQGFSYLRTGSLWLHIYCALVSQSKL